MERNNLVLEKTLNSSNFSLSCVMKDELQDNFVKLF